MSGTEEQQGTQAGSEGQQNNAGTQSGTDTTAQEIAALKAEISDLRKEAVISFFKKVFLIKQKSMPQLPILVRRHPFSLLFLLLLIIDRH